MAAAANDEKKQDLPPYPNYIGKTTDIDQELANLKTSYGQTYAELYKRTNEYVDTFDYKDKTLVTLTIMQFNILADGLSGTHVSESKKDEESQSKTFVNVPKECLVFNYRGFRILEEITRNEPDIICLQECDQFGFLLHYLSPKGFSGEFNPKSSSPCVKIAKAGGFQLNADGVAIFYLTQKFKVKKVEKFGKTIEQSEEDIPAMNILFTDIKTNKDFIIATCHLKSAKNIKGEIRRLNQLQHFLPKTQALSVSALTNTNAGVPVFLSCDLNTNNGQTYSTVYDSMMFPQKVKLDKENDAKFGLKPDLPKGYIDGYGLGLWSAYYSYEIGDKKKNSEPIYTTYKRRSNGVMKHCIDYILYQRDKGVTCTRLLSVPSVKKINQKTLLPGFEYPSDHVAIQACFQF